jgi:hypothetical protein
VVNHQGSCSESWGQPPSSVGDRPAKRVTKRPVEWHTAEPRSRGPNPRKPPNQSIPPQLGRLRAPRAVVFNVPSPDAKQRLQTVSVSIILCYSVRCPLWSPAMRQNAGAAKQIEGRRQIEGGNLVFCWLIDWLVGLPWRRRWAYGTDSTVLCLPCS